eukprot:16541-Heterococcus_DN1.PRE.5
MEHSRAVCYLTCVVHDNCCNRLLMSVIKGCLKEENKELKKLVMIYWEVRGVTAMLYVRKASALLCQSIRCNSSAALHLHFQRVIHGLVHCYNCRCCPIFRYHASMELMENYYQR